MVLVKGGEFKMGNVAGVGDLDELPVHTVKLEDYYIAQTEITVAQWKAYCTLTARPMPPRPSWGWIDNHPIVNVSWHDTETYCQWLSEKTGNKYRLPTEAEWEFAARGGTKSNDYLFSGGNEVSVVGYYDSISPTGTKPIKGKLPNELGIFDMSGNVWEWCADFYAPRYSHPDSAVDSSPSKGVKYRAIRGGGWVAPAMDLRVSNRWRSEPDIPRDYLGFRPVMEK